MISPCTLAIGPEFDDANGCAAPFGGFSAARFFGMVLIEEETPCLVFLLALGCWLPEHFC